MLDPCDSQSSPRLRGRIGTPDSSTNSTAIGVDLVEAAPPGGGGGGGGGSGADDAIRWRAGRRGGGGAVCELFQSRAEGKALGETCLIGSTVNTIQKQRSIHNHRGSLAVTGNGQGLGTDGNPPVRASTRGFKLEGGEN